MSVRWLLCLVLTLCALPTARAEGRRVVYAIAIGNNLAPTSDSQLRPLRYADDDAVKVYRLFARSERNSLLTMLDAETARRYPELSRLAALPSYGNLRATLERYRAAMERDRARGDVPVLFLTFSGHGSADVQGDPSLALVDVPLTRARLYDELLPLVRDAEVHLIVDACRAAGVIGVRGGFGPEVEGETVSLSGAERESLLEAPLLSRFPNVGALIATAADQETHEWSRIESGVFTHEVLSALRGAADVNGDLAINYSEVQAFVAAANRDVPNPKARPSVLTHVPRQGGDALLLSLAELGGVRLLHGDAGALGHFHVELENGERLLDAHLAPGHRAALALPATEGAFVRTAEHEAEVTAARGAVALAALSFHRQTMATRGSIERSLRDTLFKSAYGPTYYRGFVDSVGVPGVRFQAPTAIPVDGAEPWRPVPRRALAIGLGVVAGVALAASVTSAGLARGALRDFEATTRERRAHELQDAYQRRVRAAIGTGVLALASGGAAFLVWPRVSRDAGATSVALEASVRF
jgi:hypothetical protein